MEFVWNIEPMGAPRTTRADAWKQRPVILKYHRFRDLIAIEMKKVEREAGCKIWVRLDCLEVMFQIPMSKSWSKKKRIEMNGAFHQQKPDIDNLVKAVLDSIFRGGDDCKVATIHAMKRWSNDGRIIITI